MKIKKVIFISSTSVYQPVNRTVREHEEGEPGKQSGQALLIAEKILTGLNETLITILRFGGLIGADRNPGNFLRGKKEVSAYSPVNLIHRDDCVEIILQIIKKEIWGEVFNACSPGHPTKKEFYTKAAKLVGLPAPQFSEEHEMYKIVNSDKLIEKLGYQFKYPNPMDYLKELEEWSYRI